MKFGKLVAFVAFLIAAPLFAQAPAAPAETKTETKKGAAPGIHVTELTTARRNFEIVMSKGDEAVKGLEEFAKANNIQYANFTAIGAFDHAILGWYDPEKRAYKQFPIDEEVEIASLTGNIRPDRNGNPTVHIHCVLGKSDNSGRAGHLIEGRISLTLQLYMTDAVSLVPPKPAAPAK